MGDVLGKALVNTVIGIGTVFAVLIVIMLIIFLFKIFPVIEKRMADKKAAKEAAASPSAAKAAPAPAVAPVAAAGSDVTIAVIAAAVEAFRASQGVSDPGAFVVRSIKRRF